MTARAAWEAAARRWGPVRAAAVPTLVALALVIGFEPSWNARLPAALFDAWQTLSPRRIVSMPATIVEIDQRSLAVLGQWPWPRFRLAELVDEIARHRPAAIGIDILMPEADALSPERLLSRVRGQDPELAARLAALPGNDALLARAIAAAPSVLAIAGMPDPTGMTLRATPFGVHGAAASAGGPLPGTGRLARYGGVLASVDALDAAAPGRGLISVEPSGGVIRRVPLVASVDGTLVPALSIEMLRIAVGAPSLRLLADGPSARGVAIGEFVAPTEADGSARVYYSPRSADRFVSAVDVLDGRVDPAQFSRKLVLIGVTGVGTIEDRVTPLGVTMPGVEIHAQLLENLYDGTLLRRPAWAGSAEALAFLLLGSLLVVVTPRWKPRDAALVATGGAVLLLASSYAAFRISRLTLDAATPALCLLALFGVLLVLTLAEATREKRSLERVVQAQREAAARIAGELDAAKRIQVATLPRTDFLKGDGRVDLAATMTPAREVGGDLYDFFRLDEHRLFLAVGDVAGKGLSASIFQAVSKALCKSAILRSPTADLGELMSATNAEISRDNPEMLFVTAFAAILDLDTGVLAYCNAGHENPLRVHAGDGAVRRIDGGDGPPLCAVDGFAYRSASCRMRPGEWLCIVTDGVSEAQRADGELYGIDRVAASLPGLTRGAASARAVVDALAGEVAAFAAGAEPADDLTVLVLRWNGPPAADAPAAA